MPVDPEVRAVLLRAADLCERGWCQGSNHKPGRHCANGAIEHADGQAGGMWLTASRSRLRKTIGQYEIARWNDAPERTQAEVVSALRRAAGGEDARCVSMMDPSC